MNEKSLQQYLLEDIDPLEDDVDDESDDSFAFSSGAPTTANTTSRQLKTGLGYTNLAVQQGLSITGKVANVANLAQTGNVLSAASTGVSAAMVPVVAITGPIGLALSLVDSAFSGYSAYKTSGHIRQLERIMKDYGPQAKDGTLEAIAFCIKKKNKKLKRKGVGCVPVLGSLCNTVYTAGRSIQKRWNGTRGVERRQRASELWQNTLIGDVCAIEACKELLGIKIYKLIEGMGDGHLVLKKKLRSL